MFGPKKDINTTPPYSAMFGSPDLDIWPSLKPPPAEAVGHVDGSTSDMMKLSNELLQMDDQSFAMLLERVTRCNDEFSRNLAARLNRTPEPDGVPSRSPGLLLSDKPHDQPTQPRSDDSRLIIRLDVPAESPTHSQPISSNEIRLSELPDELRSQLLDFLHRRDEGRFTEMGNESDADLAQSSKTLSIEDKGSMRVPRFFLELGLTDWELKERRDAYRLATATGLRDLTQAGFDLESAWTSHSIQEQESAVTLFMNTLERIVGYYISPSPAKRS